VPLAVIGSPFRLAVIAAVPTVVADVRSIVYVPSPLSTGAQARTQLAGKEPRLVDTANVSPPVAIAFPFASFAVIVTVDVLVPSAVIVPGDTESVDVVAEAAPGTTENVLAADVSEPAVAVTVIGPADCPVTVSEATPLEAVAVPRPVSAPEPAVFANVTVVELSEPTTLSSLSRISTVSVFVAPAATLAAPLV
jgi:hypothetical protein